MNLERLSEILGIGERKLFYFFQDLDKKPMTWKPPEDLPEKTEEEISNPRFYRGTAKEDSGDSDTLEGRRCNSCGDWLVDVGGNQHQCG